MKQRCAWALLVVAAVWPGATLVLQRAFDVDPWKLMSFGMYSTPPRRPQDLTVELHVRRAGEWAAVPVDASRFRGDRQALGELASLEPLWRQAWQVKGADAARVVVGSPRLDPASARVRVVTSTHERVK